MPRPTISDVHVNRPLTNLSLAFIQDATSFISDKVFPNIPVNSKSDLYFTYDRGEFNRDEMRERAPGTESAGGSYKLATDSYLAHVYAFHKDVDDQIRANADSPLNLDKEATQYLTNKALLKREKIWASKFFVAGVWTTDVTGQAGASDATHVQYWNISTSTPIADIRKGIKTIHKSTGMKPRTLVLGASAWYALLDNPDLIDRVKYSTNGNTNPAQVSKQTIATLLELDNIFVMEAIENTAKEGQANVSAFIGDKSALLCYAAPSAGLMTASAGYTFSWTGLMGSGAAGNRISMFRMEHLKSDRVEIEMAFDQKLVAPDLGYFFSNCVQ